MTLNTLKVCDHNPRAHNTINTTYITLKPLMCGNSCIFDTPSRKPVQNSKKIKYPKVKNIQIKFI